MRLAVERLSSSRNILSTTDYSDLQILGLEYDPLHKYIVGFEKIPEGTSLILRGDRAPEFTSAIKDFLKKNKRIADICFKGLLEISASSKNKINLVHDQTFDIKALRVPNIAVKSNERVYFENLITIKNPKENHELFNNGELHFHCDTAIDLSQVNSSYMRRFTGLIGSIHYNPEFKKSNIFNYVHHILVNFNPSKTLKNYERVITKSPTTRGLKSDNTEIVVAYDPIYPNRIIGTELAASLRKHGINAKAISDNEYSASDKYHLKYSVTRPIGDADCYYWMWCLNFTNEYAKRQIILNMIDKRVPFNWSFLSEMGIAVPLFKVPSLYKAKDPDSANPLLNLFSGIYE